MKPSVSMLALGKLWPSTARIVVISVIAVFALTTPVAATTFTVDNNGHTPDANPGDGTCADTSSNCTLLAAIQEVNAYASNAPHTIGFSVTSPLPTSELPQVIRTGTVIDGWSHPSFVSGGAPVVVLSGESAGNAIGIRIGGNDITIRGLKIYSFQRSGIVVEVGITGATVQGCYIGTNGTTDLGNGEYGIYIGAASNNTIGGTGTDHGNVISGNGLAGVAVSPTQGGTATGNTILGNLIGLNAAGTSAIANSDGVTIYGPNTSSNTVGGNVPAARNVISGNTHDGVTVVSGASSNMIQGNYIGTNASGAQALPNGRGVHLLQGAFGTSIGGSGAGEGNVISGNTDEGIFITGGSSSTFVLGNLIGVDASGDGALGNGSHGVHALSAPDVLIGGPATGEANIIAFNGGSGVVINEPPPCILKHISANSIHDNTGLGIDLGDDGVTPNDPGDADAGPNNLQNFPVIEAVTSDGGQIEISGTFNSTANGFFRLEFFSSPACDSSGYGEGAKFIDGLDVTTDGSGDVAFSTTIPGTLEWESVVTATATDSSGNTSEFSACVVADVEPLPVPPVPGVPTAVPTVSPVGGFVLAALLAAAAVALLRRRTS